jgi:hypothetical protein
VQPRGQPPLLCAGLVGHLLLGAPQQLLGLLSGFGGHLLRLLPGDARYLLSGFTGTLCDTGSLLLCDVSVLPASVRPDADASSVSGEAVLGRLGGGSTMIDASNGVGRGGTGRRW